MKQQTAVEWLIEKLESSLINTTGDYKVKLIIGLSDIEQAKEMEKEQIKEAYFIGGHQMKNNKYIGMHDYYNETYGGKK